MDVLIQSVGAVLLVAGVWMIYMPAALIIAGLCLAVIGTLRELGKDEHGTRETPAEGDAASTRDEAA